MIQRTLKSELERNALYYPVIGILGPRQSGKTTLAQQTFSKHTYISLEDRDKAYHATHDPRDFLRIYKNDHGIILDEFQNVPSLLSYIQTYVDEHKQNGYFILTGSQNFLMNEAISQTLAGRISIHTLLPLTAHELNTAGLLPEEPEEALISGFYPPVFNKKSLEKESAKTNKDQSFSIEKWYLDYIRTYVERDIRQITHVTDLMLFQKFIQLCAARIGQVVNYTSLGNECGISDVTAKKWLTLLETSYIVFLLHPHHKNFNKRIIKNPKLYFYDTGLAAALLQIPLSLLKVHPIKGSFFESFAIAELMKTFYNKGQRPNLFFWRDSSGNEVDCIIDRGLSLIPIEIKSNITISSKFFDGLEYWKKIAHIAENQGFIIYAGTENQERSNGTIIGWKSIESGLTQHSKNSVL